MSKIFQPALFLCVLLSGSVMAGGQTGYLEKRFAIATMEAAGFESVAGCDINENPNDQTTSDDAVWRLPPTLMTSRDSAEMKAEMEAIGESNRMTLMFRKPGE